LESRDETVGTAAVTMMVMLIMKNVEAWKMGSWRFLWHMLQALFLRDEPGFSEMYPSIDQIPYHPKLRYCAVEDRETTENGRLE
jgi:hypothetical protein